MNRYIKKQSEKEECNKECMLVCSIIVCFHVVFMGTVVYLINAKDDFSFSS